MSLNPEVGQIWRVKMDLPVWMDGERIKLGHRVLILNLQGESYHVRLLDCTSKKSNGRQVGQLCHFPVRNFTEWFERDEVDIAREIIKSYE